MPVALVGLLEGHDAEHARDRGWSGLRNGVLLKSASDAGFQALVTVDANLIPQQNRASLAFAVVVVRAPSNRIEDLRPVVAVVLTALRSLQPRTWVEVGRPPGRPGKRR